MILHGFKDYELVLLYFNGISTALYAHESILINAVLICLKGQRLVFAPLCWYLSPRQTNWGEEDAGIDEILDLERKWSIFFYLELEN